MNILIDDISINYAVSGQGTPLLFLHGWGLNCHEFDKVANQINEDFKVYQIDLPGFGETKLNKDLTVSEYADIINKFCLRLAIINPIVIGHSFGGRVAISYASRYDISKLVLVCTPGVPQRFSLSKYIKIKIYKLLKKMNISLKMGSADYKNSSDILRKVLVKALNTDLTEDIKSIKCETLLIYGKNDKAVPLYIGHKINNLIKKSEIVEVNACGHFPYREKFRFFLIILKYFIYGSDV